MAQQKTRVVIMAGLPGSGKSALSKSLSEQLDGLVLNKDVVRAALFPGPWTEYSQRQDDFCMEVLLQAAAYLIRRDPPPTFLFIDGRTFASRYQIEHVMKWAAEMGCETKVILALCSDGNARQRLAESHIAQNRSFEAYLKLKANFEPISYPKLTVNTDDPLHSCLQQCLTYLRTE